MIQHADWDDRQPGMPSLSPEEAKAMADKVCDELEKGQHLLMEDEDGVLHPVFIPARKSHE